MLGIQACQWAETESDLLHICTFLTWYVFIGLLLLATVNGAVDRNLPSLGGLTKGDPLRP